MKKSELRSLYLDKRKSLPQEEIQKQSDIICKFILQNFDLAKLRSILSYSAIPTQHELDISCMHSKAVENSLEVYLPRVSGKFLECVPIIGSTDYVVNSWNIKEPLGKAVDNPAIDICFVPMVYCDPLGNRIGYGKGYYDRFFGTSNKDLIKIGISAFPPKENIDDVDSKDIAMDAVLIPERPYLVTFNESLDKSGFLKKSKK